MRFRTWNCRPGTTLVFLSAAIALRTRHRQSTSERNRLWNNTLACYSYFAPGEVREAGEKLLLEPFRAPQPLHETVNLALSVHQLLLAGVEGVAL